MVSDVIEELMDIDMERKLESLWWTSTHQAEERKKRGLWSRGVAHGTSLFKGYRCQRERKGLKVQTGHNAKAWPVGGETDASIGRRVCPCKQYVAEFSVTSTVLP